jgi:hypothetical protein
MSEPFPIRDATLWPTSGDEVLGSKPKVWLQADDGFKWLFKENHRVQSGDDWTEKVAAEIAGLLGVPHATVELASRGDRRGVISRDLVKETGAMELTLGNSLLVQDDNKYPLANRYHVAEHTIDRIFDALLRRSIGLPIGAPADPAVEASPDLFVGYLMLDALIGNSDRHHENWAVLRSDPANTSAPDVLCPSFDHASCLGHNLLDNEREQRLNTKDQGYSVVAFARRARSAIYLDASQTKPMTTLEAFRDAAARRSDAGRFWLSQLADIDSEQLTDIVVRVPDAMIGEWGKRFAVALLKCNRSNLLAEVSP